LSPAFFFALRVLKLLLLLVIVINPTETCRFPIKRWNVYMNGVMLPRWKLSQALLYLLCVQNLGGYLATEAEKRLLQPVFVSVILGSVFHRQFS